jgi:hypothetical protein
MKSYRENQKLAISTSFHGSFPKSLPPVYLRRVENQPSRSTYQGKLRYNARMHDGIRFLRTEVLEGGTPPRTLDFVFEIAEGQERRVRVAGSAREELCESGMRLIPESEFQEPAREWLCMQLRKNKSDLVFELPTYVLPEWRTHGSIPTYLE